MKKRCVCILLILCLVVSTTACQSSHGKKTSGEIVNPGERTTLQITMLVTPNTYQWMQSSYFKSYIDKFKQQYGVKVNFEKYGADYETAASDLMTKLITKNGPELIVDDRSIASNLIQQGAVLNVRGKIPNLEKVYPNLIDDEVYYVPVGMEYNPILLRKEMLQELQLPIPDLNWTLQDYYDIRDKWLQQSVRMFSVRDLNETIYRYIHELGVFDYENKKAHINTNEMQTALDSIKTVIFSGQYKINKNYKYTNYYNMEFEINSKEHDADWSLQSSREYEEQHIRNLRDEGMTNALFARSIDLRSLSKSVTLPYNLTGENMLWTMGFMMNKNGANLELAYEFLNGLLSDEAQLQMFEQERIDIYPVSQAIEKEILDQEQKAGYSEETLKTKAFILNLVKNEEFSDYELRMVKQDDQYWMLVKDLLKYIFSDKDYSDAELSAELQKLEDKFDIYLNE